VTWARECDCCGGPIPDHKRIDAMVCGSTCRHKLRKRLEREARLEARDNRPPCLHCGAAMPAEKSPLAKFCSTACAYENRNLQRRKG